MASAMARRLLSVLQESPTVVLTYPLTQRIDPGGASLAKPARQFETFGVADLDARWTRFNRSDAVAAGDIVYGLMRTEAARAAGIFRYVLCPDRLLIAELTLRGEIRQVPEVLWYRRQFAAGSIERQRSTLFAPGTQPPSRFTPPWYMHARSLWDTYGRASHPRVVLPRGTIARLIVRYAAAYAWRHYAKSSVQRGILAVLGWPRWIYKRVKHAVLLGRVRLASRAEANRGHAAYRAYLRAVDRTAASLAGARVKILFIARHFTYFRNYESVVAALAASGHQIHLAAERDEYLGGRALVERLAADHPALVSFGWIPDRDDIWATFVTKLRMTLDYLRYLEPAYSSTPRLRERAQERVPRLGLWLLAVTAVHTNIGRRLLRTVLAGL